MKKFLLSITALLVLIHAQAQQQLKPFQQGDRVAFVGNSITDNGHYHSYIWLYYMTRFPNRRIEVMNGGIGGDDVKNITTRIDKDVFARKPNIMTLTFGMNDSGYMEYFAPDAAEKSKNKIQVCYDRYQVLEQKLKNHPEIKKIIIASSPYDQTAKIKTKPYPKKNDAIGKIAEFQQASAKKNNWGFIDFQHPMTAINVREQQTDSAFTLCGRDRIHPDNDGHMVMTYLFLKGQGLAGYDVADVNIDAAGKKVRKTVNCTITNLVSTKNGVKFNYLAGALPFPVDTLPKGFEAQVPASRALKVVPFTDDMNREMVYVNGLTDGNYTLKIDGRAIGKWAAADYVKGINLATIVNTPQYQQALSLMHMNEERFQIERRLRMYIWMNYGFLQEKGLLYNDGPAAMDSVNKASIKNPFVRMNQDNYTLARFPEVREGWRNQQKAIVNQIYTSNKPKNHLIEVVAE
ncbi:MAG: SGNH/GDSL hydrolase family protein [Mucilaginibacter sp.]